MHWWRGLSLDCSLLKDRSRKRQLWKQPYTSRNCCTYSFLKQSTMIISPGKAEQHIFKSNHTQRDLLPVLPTHQLIKSILKNVSVSVCNLFELLISAFHGPLAEQPYLSLFVVGCPAMVTPVQISLLVAPHPKTHTFSESL